MGIYLNGGRKEEGLLLNFWKDHVSEAYRNHNKLEKEKLKMETTLRKKKEMLELEKNDPAAFRRLMLEKEKK